MGRTPCSRVRQVVLVAVLCACGSDPEPARPNGTWRLGPPMNEARAGHSVTLLADGRVLVAGGDALTDVAESGGALATAEVFDPVTETWTPTGSMNTARTWHTAVLLTSGRVLVAGGCAGWTYDPVTNRAGCLITPSAELFDPVNGAWTPTGDMEFARMGPLGGTLGGALLPDGRVLVAGSWHRQDLWIPEGTATTPSELYDPASGRWARVGDLATPSMGGTLLPLLSGRVLLAGGITGGAALACTSAAQAFDLLSLEWSGTGALPQPTAYNAMARLRDGRVLVAAGCGWDGYSCNSNVLPPFGHLYDPGMETWRATGPMSFNRQHASAVVLPSGRVLVSGGWFRSPDSVGMAPAGDVYDPATDTWTPTPPLLASEIGGGASVLLPTGEVLHAGGYRGTVWSATAATQLYRE